MFGTFYEIMFNDKLLIYVFFSALNFIIFFLHFPFQRNVLKKSKKRKKKYNKKDKRKEKERKTYWVIYAGLVFDKEHVLYFFEELVKDSLWNVEISEVFCVHVKS